MKKTITQLQEEVRQAEKQIIEMLKTEHIDFLTPNIMIHAFSEKINSILFTKDGRNFGFFIISFGSLGHICKGKESNTHLPMGKSELLQNMIKTIVEETLDREIK